MRKIISSKVFIKPTVSVQSLKKNTIYSPWKMPKYNPYSHATCIRFKYIKADVLKTLQNHYK